MTVRDLADELLKYFVTENVKDSFGSHKQFFLTDEHPKFLKNIIYRVHKEDYDMLPDDFKYEFVYRALVALAEYDDPYEADMESYVDVYTSDLMRWLNSHSYRQELVDEAIQEGITNLFNAMQHAQLSEMNKVLDIVREELVERAEEEGCDEE